MGNENGNMSGGEHPVVFERISLREVADQLIKTRPFSGISLDELPCAEFVDRVQAKAGTPVVEAGDPLRSYWLVLEGQIRADRPEQDRLPTTVGFASAGEGFGEVPLFIGKTQSPFYVIATQDSLLLRFSEQSFWSMLACCPSMRKVVLNDTAQRLKAHQQEALHREKLVSLGTMAAGLMHELSNPGSAAKRAASQLRENMMRLQELSLRNAGKQKTPDQLQCMHDLLKHALRTCHTPAMSSLDQSDAEEALAEWLSTAGVENAYSIAPSLVAIGFEPQELKCAREHFEHSGFSDALNWLEALVSSVSLVCAIEESITRVSELVMAVKKFAYDERTPMKELDVHDSLQSTLTILGHKLRLKQIHVEKKFAAVPSTIQTRGSALNQVWTNLIDNAVDASPEQSQIEISTWYEPDEGNSPGSLAVSIADHGSGIPADVLPHIFEPFFTTKPLGSGTGLGLEIAERIVTQKFGGKIEVVSEPGYTKFIVRLPLGVAALQTPAPATVV